jgi:hypothetical protein
MLLWWKRNFFSYPSREVLVKCVLFAMPTFFPTVYKMPKCAHSKMDRIRRSFMWKGHTADRVRGGHCLVNWQIFLRPNKWGGLGITDLDRFSRALRLHCLWRHWDHVDRCWKNLLKITDKMDRQLFFCSEIPHSEKPGGCKGLPLKS